MKEELKFAVIFVHLPYLSVNINLTVLSSTDYNKIWVC